MKKFFTDYKFLFCAYCLVRILLIFFYSETPSLFIEEYESAAKNFISGNGFSVLVENKLVPLTLYPPGYSFFIALLYKLFGIKPILIQLAQVFISGFALVLFAKTVADYFQSQSEAIKFGFIYLLIPIFWIQDITLNTGASLATSFSLIAFYFLHKKANHFMLLSGLFAAAAASIRSEYIILLPVFLGILFIKSKRKIALAVFSLGCLVILFPLSLRNYSNFKAISPLPGGAGLALVNVIGKFYPDKEKEFAFGDDNILAVEKGNFKDLTYPNPYEREKSRMSRSLNFIKENPGKYCLVLLKNAPRAILGQQLYLAGGGNSFQEFIAKGGDSKTFIKNFPLKFADIFLGLCIASLLLLFAVVFFFFSAKKEWLQFLPFIVPAILFFVFFIFLGTLGRYTLPGYTFLSPISYLGAKSFLTFIRKKDFKIKTIQ